MKKLLVVCLITLTAGFSSACVASRKFVRNEVKTSSDALNSRVDTTNGELKETRDNVDRVNQRVTTVDGRVTELDSKTAQGMSAIKGDVQAVDQKAGQATTLAQRATGEINTLDQKFQNRNQYSVLGEKAIQFKFDSDKLSDTFKTDLDQIADAVIQNPNAIVVLEGRTDSTGNGDYNVKLGERRVEAVRRYLAVDKNVPVYRIHVISLGAARPIASNDSRDGREKNRAVTISVLAPTVDGSVASRDNN